MKTIFLVFTLLFLSISNVNAANEAASFKSDVVQLVYKYYLYFDSFEPNKQVDLWDENMEMVTPWSSITDKKKFKEWNLDLAKTQKNNGGVRHFVINPIVELDGIHADFTAYITAVNQKTGKNQGTFLMKAEVKNTNNGLRFTKMSFEADENAGS